MVRLVFSTYKLAVCCIFFCDGVLYRRRYFHVVKLQIAGAGQIDSNLTFRDLSFLSPRAILIMQHLY